MAKIIVNDTNLTNIANAIREKNGETTSYKVDEMAEAINEISAKGTDMETCNVELYVSKSITYQTTYTTINDNGVLETIYTSDMTGTNNIVCVKGTPITIVAYNQQLEPYVYIKEIVDGSYNNISDGVSYSLFSFSSNDNRIALVSSIDCGTSYTNVYIGLDLEFNMVGPGEPE